MTNLERCRRTIGHHPSCMTCDAHDESTLHVLRDCKFARELWNARNEYVFNSISQSSIFVWNGLFWARFYTESFSQPLTRSPILRSYHWLGPGLGWVCMNVDATVSTSQVLVQLLVSFVITQGLGLQDFRKLLIQSDCAEAVKLINADNASNSLISLIRAIVALRQKGWVTDITWIPRESNLPADMLAKSGDPCSIDLHELSAPPATLLPLFSMDAMHLSFVSM
ncbi:hypothetical protein V6N12_065118 [Hibiscus sabdariffa]|uniref:RNase H type-1 domain-containing protein n=1 Tax=Hibiscus sabdariffa TaxID=183260 RepID=A0ABR2G7T6_9ROSI